MHTKKSETLLTSPIKFKLFRSHYKVLLSYLRFANCVIIFATSALVISALGLKVLSS